jgi:hypothetical protein
MNDQDRLHLAAALNMRFFDGRIVHEIPKLPRQPLRQTITECGIACAWGALPFAAIMALVAAFQ